MGWLFLALLGGAALALLWRLGMPLGLWSFAGAALMLGASGYALQGRPGLSGHPVAPEATKGEVDPGLSDLRLRLFGRHTVAEPYFVAADALTRSGARASAVKLFLGGIANDPGNFALWSGLGEAYAAHDGDTLSPAARFAFARALQLAPEHPGPPFFLGLAAVKAGDLEEARRWWVRAYRLSPRGTSYRQEIGLRLVLLDRFMSENVGAPAGR